MKRISPGMEFASRSVRSLLGEHLKLQPYKVQIVRQINGSDYKQLMNISVEFFAKCKKVKLSYVYSWRVTTPGFHLSGFMNNKTVVTRQKIISDDNYINGRYSQRITTWRAVLFSGNSRSLRFQGWATNHWNISQVWRQDRHIRPTSTMFPL